MTIKVCGGYGALMFKLFLERITLNQRIKIMPGQTRKFDRTTGICNHGLPCCPHNVTGIFMQGSTDCDCNGLASQRVYDMTMHDCPHCPNGMVTSGSTGKKVNGLGAARLGDPVTEFYGTGIITSGSGDTDVG